MRSRADVDAARALAARGLSASEVAAQLRIPRSTVRDWLAGRARNSAPGGKPCAEPGQCVGRAAPDMHPAEYAYLLGLYLGDGYISPHHRGVYRLRVYLDIKYPEIIGLADESITVVRGRPTHRRTTDKHCLELGSYWKHRPCCPPQHGPGLKHLRPNTLTDWQQAIVDRYPELLLRGLIQSDGCRFQNTGRGGWSNPRYSFFTKSTEIAAIFRATCERIGVHWTAAGPYTTYVSRKADVATLDSFIGPKR